MFSGVLIQIKISRQSTAVATVMTTEKIMPSHTQFATYFRMPT